MNIPGFTVQSWLRPSPSFLQAHRFGIRARLLPLVVGFGFLFACGESAPAPSAPPRPTLRLGSDRLLEEPFLKWIDGKSVGLVANQTSMNSRLEGTAGALSNHPRIELKVIFAPEHGYSGDIQAGVPVPHRSRIYSLYGTHYSPTPEMLRGVDLLIYDIQDVGVRFYTYISTLYECMKAAAREGIPLIVLDRPNPIGGTRIEGPLLDPSLVSFVGIHPIPIRYGMTAGELARLFNHEGNLGCELRVVPMKGWKRTQWYDETGLVWIPPSPNMPTLTTATLYAGFCLLEGTNLSEGRGTTRPFELVGAPWLDAVRLASALNALELPGVHFRVQSFKPTFSKYKGQLCRGVQIHIVDRDRFDPISCVLHLLRQILDLHPKKLKFQEQMFDLLAGQPGLRSDLLEGVEVERMVASWRPELESFRERRSRHLLYPEEQKEAGKEERAN